jgi:hypothetical protein
MWKWFKKSNNDIEAQIPKEEMNENCEDIELIVRQPNEVAKRILALYTVIGKVHNGNDEVFLNWFKSKSMNQYLSEDEANLLKNESPNQNTLLNFSWRAEALTSLLWAAKLIEEMPALNQEFDVFSLSSVANILSNPLDFINNLQLRPNQELEAMESELFNQHWRVRDAQINSREMPSELDPSVVYERRYALSWLIGWGQDWDHVPTDT